MGQLTDDVMKVVKMPLDKLAHQLGIEHESARQIREAAKELLYLLGE